MIHKNLYQRGQGFYEPIELSIVISSHQSWLYNPDWKMWQYFRRLRRNAQRNNSGYRNGYKGYVNDGGQEITA